MSQEIDLEFLKTFTFGSPAAERDENLERYFVESESFRKLDEGNKSIALGNRGAGKTAIFKMIAEQAERSGRVVIKLAPEDYSYQVLSEHMIKESQGSWHKHTSYTVAWKYVLYVLIMKRITSTGPRLKTGSAAKIYTYLRDHHGNIETNPIAALISYLKRLEGIKIGSYEASIKLRELDKLYKLEEINNLIPALNELTAKRNVLVLVDELDRGWDSSEDAKAFVVGLFEAALQINNASKGVRVLLSLRKELYNSIPSLYDDAQKVRDIIEVIDWDESSLLELISKRIAVAFPGLHETDHSGRWNLFFAETLDYRKSKSFNYLVDRTLYRPREIIQFCESIRELALRNKVAPPLDYKIISEAELQYSELRVKDIAAEYKFEYPGLLNVFETFRGLPYSFERTGLELHCLRVSVGELDFGGAKLWCEDIAPDQLIRILWTVGFLKAQAVGGLKARSRSGSAYLGSHQVGTLSLGNLNRFHVHPMFRTYLGMKEGTYDPEKPGMPKPSSEDID